MNTFRGLSVEDSWLRARNFLYTLGGGCQDAVRSCTWRHCCPYEEIFFFGIGDGSTRVPRVGFGCDVAVGLGVNWTDFLLLFFFNYFISIYHSCCEMTCL